MTGYVAGFLFLVFLFFTWPWLLTIGILITAHFVGRSKRKAPKPAPAKATPAPAAPPLPDYIPRWNRARIIQEWKDLASFQRQLDGR